MKYYLVTALVVALLSVDPILVIWALNTLFPELALQYGIAEWAAVVVLSHFFNSSVKVIKQ
jgi:hypothetical protein